MGIILDSFRPALYYDSIFEIDLEKLQKKGINGLIVDLDNTLIPRHERVASKELQTWLKMVEEAGFKVCIISNNWRSRAKAIASKVNLPFIALARKPRKRAFTKGLAILGTNPQETAVVGDQIFTDVFGGNRVGLLTILVAPLSGPEFFSTRIMRRVEKVILRQLERRNLLRKDNQKSKH